MEEELSEKDIKELAEVARKQQLIDMKLHEKMVVGSSDVQRVVGGWIYWRSSNGVFVPEPKKPPKQE